MLDTPALANNPLTRADELADLGIVPLAVRAGFTLYDPSDPTYRRVATHRKKFGEVVRKAALALQQNAQGEDGNACPNLAI